MVHAGHFAGVGGDQNRDLVAVGHIVVVQNHDFDALDPLPALARFRAQQNLRVRVVPTGEDDRNRLTLQRVENVLQVGVPQAIAGDAEVTRRRGLAPRASAYEIKHGALLSLGRDGHHSLLQLRTDWLSEESISFNRHEQPRLPEASS